MQPLSFLGLLKHPRLSKLFVARWTGQTTDGIFQSALASFLLFSPERQASALSAAVAFAVVLLPYSLIGPFVGTVLDRVSRQRALFFANILRAVDLVIIAGLVSNGRTGIELTIFVLTAFGINRLILAGLSAGLPLMVDQENLITANATAVTGGSILVVVGGGVGFGIRKVSESLKDANHSDALIILLAALGYLITALLLLRLKRKEIGPLDHETKSASIAQGFIEMREGLEFLTRHKDAARGIVATAIQRGGITSLLLIALLLERNTFNQAKRPEDGLSGLALALSIAGVGIMFGALIAPYGVSRYGRHRWIRLMMLGSAVSPLFLIFSISPISLYLTGFFVSLCGQSLKVTTDALVQSKIDDTHRGRVFAVYDVVVNASIVSGALCAALVLPTSGKSVVVPLLVSIAYFTVFLHFLRPKKFNV